MLAATGWAPSCVASVASGKARRAFTRIWPPIELMNRSAFVVGDLLSGELASRADELLMGAERKWLLIDRASVLFGGSYKSSRVESSRAKSSLFRAVCLAWRAKVEFVLYCIVPAASSARLGSARKLGPQIQRVAQTATALFTDLPQLLCSAFDSRSLE